MIGLRSYQFWQFRATQEKSRIKDGAPAHLINGDVRQSVTGSSTASSGPPVVSITSGKPFMEALSNSSSKQTASNVSHIISGIS